MEVNVATGKYIFLSPEIDASRATSIDATLYMRHQDFNIIFSSSKRSDLWLRKYFIVALIRGLTIICSSGYFPGITLCMRKQSVYQAFY